MEFMKQILAKAFSAMFLIIAALLALLACMELVQAFDFSQERDLITGIVKAINTAFISLATFELGVGIGREYSVPENGANIYSMVRRTVTRFVSVTCIALVLESLIMVIKYSQLEKAGNLPYPVAVMAGASVLLVSLGLFIHFTRPESPAADGARVRAAAPGYRRRRPQSLVVPAPVRDGA